jgi:hypothetical protein
MKIKQKSLKRNYVVAGVLFASLFSVVAVYGFALNKDQQANKPSTEISSPPTKEQSQGEATAEQSSEESLTDASKDLADDDKFSVSITSVTTNDNLLSIRTLIQPLTSDGTCTLTMQKTNEDSISKVVKIQAASTYSICQGFDIDTSQLAAGDWTATIIYKNGNHEAVTSTTTNIE